MISSFRAKKLEEDGDYFMLLRFPYFAYLMGRYFYAIVNLKFWTAIFYFHIQMTAEDSIGDEESQFVIL